MLYQGAAQGRRRHDAGRWPARRCSASPAWSRAARSAAPTTCTARCGTSTSTACSSSSWSRPASRLADELTPLEERLERDEYEHRIEQLKKEIEAEIRRRLVADRGVEAMAKTLRKPLPEDVDFMHASRDEMASLRKAIYPLTRKLAVRLARKRRHGRKGPLDFRNTVRHSLSYGGVPAEPKFRYPRPAKPEIFVIADISGSVAAFARFTLHLVYAISSQFSKVRAFVFIDGIDEVTRFFEGVEDIGEAVHRVNTEADVVWVDGHSRLRPRLRGVLGALRPGDRPQDHGAPPRRRPEQLPRLAVVGDQGDPHRRPATSTGSTPSPAVLLGHRRLDRGRVRHALRRRRSSAATCASSSASSRTWPERRARTRPRAGSAQEVTAGNRRSARVIGGTPVAPLGWPSMRKRTALTWGSSVRV